jgi:hypothetical protein
MLFSKFLTEYTALYPIFNSILSTVPSKRQGESILKKQFADPHFITRNREPVFVRCKYSLIVKKFLFYN